MTPEQHARVKDIFLAACAVPTDQRGAFLQNACGADGELRAGVEELLAHHTQSEAGTSEPAGSGDTVTLSSGQGPSDRGHPGRPDGQDGRGPSGAATHIVAQGTPPSQQFEPGGLIGNRYRIVELLGCGGMGEVYRADDLTLNQPVALKFLPHKLADDPEWLARLRQEVRVARQVTHPNVNRVYDLSEADGHTFISMEYVDGENLASLLRRIGRLPQDKALDIAQQLCAGLAAAHAKGVLHRDLKPANIMLDGTGRVRITDFGLAGTREEIPQAELRSGTPAYMAPEQLAGRDVSVQSDLYALGLVLYELYTGRPAFDAARVTEYARLHQHEPPTPPSSFLPNIDPAVERIILQCLEKDPKSRPLSAIAIAAGLPGGDALAVALSAGLTPSPQLVASAGATARLPRQMLVSSAAAFAVILGTVVYLRDRFPMAWPRLQQAPVVLTDRAQAIAGQLGLAADVKDWAIGIKGEAECPFLASPEDATRPTFFPATADVTMEAWFWLRLSNETLRPIEARNLVFGAARVTLSDPPPERPGSVSLVLDSSGRLRGLQAVPLAPDGHADARAFDAEQLFAAAGLDVGQFRSVEPEFVPSVSCDDSLAWERPPSDGSPAGLRVEAAINHGRPAVFAVLEGDNPSDNSRRRGDASRRSALMARSRSVLLLLLILAASPLAWASLGHGRGDLRGALRLGACVFILRLVAWVLEAAHAADFDDELLRLGLAVLGALGEAVVVWLFYIALEPLVRRAWPQALVGWSRVMTGRWRDPLVGRQVLFGAILGAYLCLMLHVDRLVTYGFGLSLRETLFARDRFAAMLGARHALAVCLDGLANALNDGLIIFLLIALLRSWLHRPALAGLLAGLALAPIIVPRGSHAVVSTLVLGVLGLVPVIWTVARHGLVPLVAALLVAALLLRFPLSLDLRAWDADLSLFAIAAVTGIAAFGCVNACRTTTRAAL